jgi:epsilon-lactone hydrolase
VKNIRQGFVVLLLAASAAAVSPDPQGPPPPAPDTTSLGPDGTARITRVVPVPTTISPEAQVFLRTGASWAPAAGSEEQRILIEKARALYPVRVEDAVIGGVAVRIVTPPEIPAEKKDRVLVNLHGGGFVSDSGSMLESIPIASLTRTKVVTVLYRLAPAHKFPAAVDDAIAVYRELLKTNQPRRMALYGTSAGAILSAQAEVRMRREGLPLPAAVGFFTGFADFANPGDSLAFFGVPGLEGARPPDRRGGPDAQYLGDHDPKDPLVSPIYEDLAGFPPTLCIAGTRDLLLSGTVNFHRALLGKGVDARLVVFDAMPHAHWYTVGIPEATEALELMARFFDEQLGR